MNTLWIFRNGKRKMLLGVLFLVMWWLLFLVFGLKP